ATVLKILRKNIRGIWPQIGAEILLHLGAGQLSEVARDFLLGMAPGEVRVGLRKATFCQMVLHGGTGERLCQENDLGVRGLDFVDAPFPEWERFGVGIIHAENVHTLLDPEADNAFELLPEGLPMRRFKVERINVLILLVWIIIILHGS